MVRDGNWEDRGHLLIVAGDAGTRRALKRQLAREYAVTVARSAEEGRRIAAEQPIEVIVSDQRMPGLADPIRLILIGSDDPETLIGAINDGNVLRCLPKPLDAAALAACVGEAFARYHQRIERRRLLERLTELEQRDGEHSAALEEANERLKALIAQKDAFLGMAAHDLRTPITVVQGFADLLVHTRADPEDTREFVAIIHDTLDEMLALLDDILDITAIESGKLTLRPKTVDLARFVERIVKLNRYVGAQKQIALASEIEADLPPVTFDPLRIEQVLNNLIGNAFKFSHSDTTVTVRVRRAGGAVEFAVIDEGQGIRADEIDRVFGEFQRVSSKPTADEHSTGLGLSICKRIVGLHEGQIGVESTVGVGSRFYFTLPLHEKEGQPQ